MDIKEMNILLVEDNIGDVRLTKEAFKESQLEAKLLVVYNGEDAIAFLKNKNKFKNVPKPDLILLDLNLPKKDGRQVLKEIKTDPLLKRIPVVILTTSKAIEDIIKAYELHTNCYITKPVGLEEFINVIQCIEKFWLSLVCLPPK
jgi:chemotaxis family two-component system response regulator Rcp1